MIRLGVNIDHVATIRQARGGREPDPVWAAALAELAGADGITVHLREDRRHIQDRDVRVLRETVRTRLNLEAAVAPEIVAIALEVRPDQVTFVPERRQELTTEGGLDVVGQRDRVAEAVAPLPRRRARGQPVPRPRPGAGRGRRRRSAPTAVELHTGRYADAAEGPERSRELSWRPWSRPAGAVRRLGHGPARRARLELCRTSHDVAGIAGMAELNIGHSIVSRAVFVGMERAVREMRRAILDAAVAPGAPEPGRADPPFRSTDASGYSVGLARRGHARPPPPRPSQPQRSRVVDADEGSACSRAAPSRW